MVAPAQYQFELDAGRPCLDFANTLSPSGDHLQGYADLVAFAEQSRLISHDDAEFLRADADLERAAADGVMVRAKRLRAAIASMFAAIAAGKPPSEHDVATLNFDLATSMKHARVVQNEADGGYHWGFQGRSLDAPIWPISRSAADLLTSPRDLQLLRECGGSDCLWLFLDTSKNRTRQWCSMKACGNREKARRHYQRQRQRLEATALGSGKSS
jgi:predicted RNA-binding Zn ribbon-like protein